MRKIIIIYGVISGIIVSGSCVLNQGPIPSSTDEASTTQVAAGAAAEQESRAEPGEVSIEYSEWLGYLVMLIALSVIFVGIKRYRDRELGGVIRFGTAFLLGLGITSVASVIYVAAWEVNLSLTDHAFIENYTQSLVAEKKSEGLEGADLDAFIAEVEETKRRYAKPLFRLPITFLEIFPVGLLITLISAAVLRNSRVLPATA